MLEIHPKVIARKNSIAKLKKRNSDKTKVIRLTQRIPLPFKVKHQVSTKASDPLFFGKTFVPYADGSTWLHVELLQDNQDAYVADEEDPDIDTSHLYSEEEDCDTSRLNSEENDNDDDLSYDYVPSPTGDTASFFPDNVVSPAATHKSDSIKCSLTKTSSLPASLSSTPVSQSSLSRFKSSPSRVSRIELPGVTTTTKSPYDSTTIMATLMSKFYQPTTNNQLVVSVPSDKPSTTYEGVVTRAKSPKSAKSTPSGKRKAGRQH